MPTTKAKHHHALTKAMIKQHEKNVVDLKYTIGEFTNPFEDECDQLV